MGMLRGVCMKTIGERIAILAGLCLDEMEKRETGECPKCKRRRDTERERQRVKRKKEREYGHFG